MDNFYVVHKWMITNLNLKGLEKDLYAVIYGFTQDGESKFYGSLKYLSEITGYSKQSVVASLKKLVEKNLITKYENEINGIKVCKYSVNLNGIQETLTPIKDTLHNNINNNNTFLNNKLFKNSNSKSGTDLYTFCVNCIDDFCKDKNESGLRQALIHYLNYRLEVKDKPLYKNMWKGMLSRLEKCHKESLSTTSYTDIVLYNLNRGYLTFYRDSSEKEYVSNNIHWKDDYNLEDSEYVRRDEKF